MKKLALYGTIGLLVVAFAVTAWRGSAWLFGTSEGARWALESVSRHTSVKISAGRVEGSLLGRLRLENLRVAFGNFETDVRRFDYSFQPASLLSGAAVMEQMTLDGVRVRDNSADNRPPDLAWPKVPGLLSVLDIHVKKLVARDISYSSPRNDLRMEGMSLAGVFLWRHSSLTFKNFTWKTPHGSVSGEVEAGFYQPGLRFDIAFASRRAFARMDTFSFQGNLKPGKRPEQLAGKVVLAGAEKKAGLMKLHGEVGMTGNSFNLRNFHVIWKNKTLAGVEGSILLTAGEPELRMNASLKDIDLKAETGFSTKIGGALTLDGTPSRWQGAFTLRNRNAGIPVPKDGWRKVVVTGFYTGNDRGVAIDVADASFCGGKVKGPVSLDWQHGMTMQSFLRGSGLNPGCFHPQWKGNVNFDLAGNLSWAEGVKPSGAFKGKLKDSVLHGQVLQGDVAGRFAGADLFFEKLSLKGNGFALRGAGSLAERFNFTARIDDLGKLVPDAAGKLRMDGHARYFDKMASGSLRGKGWKVGLKDRVQMERVEFDGYLGSGKDSPLFFQGTAKNIAYETMRMDSGSLKMDGTLREHGIAASLTIRKTKMQASFTGGLRDALWHGTVDSFSGQDAYGRWKLLHPAPITAGLHRLSIGSLVFRGEKTEELTIAGELGKDATAAGGAFSADWKDISLKRFKNILPKDMSSDGLLSGKMEGSFPLDGSFRTAGQVAIRAGSFTWKGEKGALDLAVPGADFSWNSETMTGGSSVLRLKGKAETKGSVAAEKTKIKLKRADFLFEGNEKGSTLSATLTPEGGGFFKADFSSTQPFHLSLPENGDFKASWGEIHAEMFAFLLPENMIVKGFLSGNAVGKVLPEDRFSMQGTLQLTPQPGAGEGNVAIKRAGGEMNVRFRNASLLWDWDDAGFSGTVSAELAEYGHLDGEFHLPVSAALPVAIDQKGPLRAAFKGKLRENGLLILIFPGFVKESHGEIEADAIFSGSWGKPQGIGHVHLTKAGAYFPQAGIEIKDVDLSARLEDGIVLVESFQAKSGSGVIEGKGKATISGGRASAYEGTLQGKNFQLIHIPELQATVSPELTFSGTSEKFILRGEVTVPELLIYGPPAGNFSTPSPDVVLTRKKGQTRKSALPQTKYTVHHAKLPVDAFDARVRVTLGDRALVKMDGIDAKLAGGINLEFSDINEIASRGEIRVVKGTYNAYGVSLQIRRGRLFYAGGAITDPSLDILALRRVRDVNAGVTIGGRINTPVIKLYSEPALPDVDILSYIVFGRALSTRTDAEQIGVLAQTAGLLLSRGNAASLQEKLKNTFGLSTLDIQSGSAGPPGSIGYQKIGGSLSQYQTASGQTKDISETLVSVGKYLTPQLYLSYGRSLFTGSNIFSLRYDISRRWQLETVTGTESGVDLYYKIYFK